VEGIHQFMNVDNFVDLLDNDADAAATASTLAGAASINSVILHQLWLLSLRRYHFMQRAATGCPTRTAQPGAGQPLPDLKSQVQIVMYNGSC
jgi:hypothetical protein